MSAPVILKRSGRYDGTRLVTMLLNRAGHVVSVHSDEATATATAARYNADPWLVGPSETMAGEPDPDAPYSVETWAVKS